MDTCGSIFPQAFVSGDDIPISVQFYQSDNVTPKPMTGYTLGMTVKTALSDQNGNPIPDSEALFQKDLPGDNTGSFAFLIPGQTADAPTLTAGSYWMDVKQWDSTGKRITVLSSSIPVTESVTQRYVPGMLPESGLQLNSLNPSTISHAGPTFTLMVNGTGFVAGSVINFDGLAEPTAFISNLQLTCSVSRSPYNQPDSVPVFVQNPDNAVTGSLTFVFT